MKVALVDPSLFTAPYDQELAKGLSTAGCKVVFYSRPRQEYETWEAREIDYQSVYYRFSSSLTNLPKRVSLPLKGMEHVLNTWNLADRLAQERPDLIHFQWCPLPMLDRLFLSRLRKVAPVVLTVHDPRPFNGNPTSAMQRLGYGRLLKGFDRLIAHTGLASQRLVEHGVAPGSVDIIPHGHLPIYDRGPSYQSSAPGTDGAARDRQNGAVTFLLLGKMKPYKGIDTLIHAVSRMPEAVRERCRFVVAGKPYMDVRALEDLCQERCVEHLFQFEFRYLSDAEMNTLISNASAVVFPYREIDASGVLMAALPYGKPIIASRLGMFETSLQDGVHGYLVEPSNEHALASALADMASQPAARAEFADNVTRLAQQQPSWSEIGRMTLDSYRRAVSGRHVPLHVKADAGKLSPVSDAGWER